MSLALAYVTSIISLLFSASLLDQYFVRRQTQHILWSVAFLLVAFAMFMWFLRESFGLNQWAFRLWYLTGATMVPALLAAGFIYWLGPRKLASAFLGYLAVVGVSTLILVLSADMNTPDWCAGGLKGLECLRHSMSITKTGFFPDWIRLLAAISNVLGGAIVLFVALRSVASLANRGGSGSTGPLITEGTTPQQVGARIKDEAVAWGQNLVQGSQHLWQNRDFWRRDESVERAYAALIVTLGLMFGGLGLALNSVDDSAPHLGFFLVATLVVYGGFLASREILSTYPHEQMREAIQAARAPGALVMPTQFGTRLNQVRSWRPTQSGQSPSSEGSFQDQLRSLQNQVRSWGTSLGRILKRGDGGGGDSQ